MIFQIHLIGNMTKEEIDKLTRLSEIKTSKVTPEEWKEFTRLNQKWLNELIAEQKKDDK
jgi:hypothetical protein